MTGTRDQESKTVKFVFLMYVGPSVGGMARGRAGGHKPDVQELIGQSHVSQQTDDKDDITEAKITDMLKKASGANYDLGSNAGGKYESKAGDIGKSAAAKYKALEKESNIGPVVFDKYDKPKDVRATWPRTFNASMAACTRARTRTPSPCAHTHTHTHAHMAPMKTQTSIVHLERKR